MRGCVVVEAVGVSWWGFRAPPHKMKLRYQYYTRTDRSAPSDSRRTNGVADWTPK